MIWIIFWEIIVVFSVISFTYMSIKMLYKGVAELTEMFKMLGEKHQ
jgi:hypothetical protein